MSWWNAVGLVSNFLNIGSSSRRQRRAYNLARQETQAEKDYKLKLEKAKLEGDPDLYKKQVQTFKPIMSYGESARQDATGVAIKQGLENSIIAQEMKNVIDEKTYQALETSADKIALHNEEYKKRAEEELDRYNMERERYLRDLAVGYESSRPDTTSQYLNAIAGFGQGGGFGGQGSNTQQSSFDDYIRQIIEDIIGENN